MGRSYRGLRPTRMGSCWKAIGQPLLQERALPASEQLPCWWRRPQHGCIGKNASWLFAESPAWKVIVLDASITAFAGRARSYREWPPLRC